MRDLEKLTREASAMTKEVILRTGHLVVVAQDLPTDTVFVTFNAIRKLAEADSFWADSFFAKERIAAIGVVTVRPNWYPAADMVEAVERIKAVTRGRRVITYGFSQGGYGALKFGRAVGASCALAFSPQFSIDPAVVGDFDRRFIAHHRPEIQNGTPIDAGDLCDHNYVFFDRRLAIDARNTAMIAAAADSGHARLYPVLVPFLGHESMWIVTEGGIGPALVRQFCADAAPARSSLRALVRGARARSETYNRARLRWLLDRSPRGTRLLTKATTSLSSGPLKSVVEVCLDVSTGEHESARRRLGALADQDLLTAVPPIWSWKYFRKHGFADGELRIARLLRDGASGDPLLRLHAVNSFITLGLRTEASLLLDDIRKMSGADLYGDHVRMYEKLLGRG